MVRIIALNNDLGPVPERTIEVIEGTPEERERQVAATKAFWRNAEWLSQQWPNLLPQAKGKFVAVADQEAFVAQTHAEADAWIREKHPADPGAFVKYVSPHKEVRTRAYQR
jgi:hypothetical protein